MIDADGTRQCTRKTQGFVQKGIVDLSQLKFTRIHLDQTKAQSAIGACHLLGDVEKLYAEHSRLQPAVQFPNLAEVLRMIFNRPTVQQTLQMNN